MKRCFLIFIILLCMFIFPIDVEAHPGRTDSKGCHKCNAANTNCASWGLADYEYHCHSGDTYTNSKGQTFNKEGVKISDPTPVEPTPKPEPDPITTPEPDPTPAPESQQPASNNEPTNNSNQNNNTSSNTTTNNNPKPGTNVYSNDDKKDEADETIKEEEKSNDTTIKSLKVNGKSIDFDDNMVVETTKKKLDLEVITNSKKAEVNYEQKELVMGENEIIIKVTAEDDTKKEYKLIVKRVEGEGSATFIELSIGTYDIEFDNYKASISLTKGETIDGISYKLSNENATVKIYLNSKEVNDIKNLKGDNILTLVTTDEDNNKLTYEVEIFEMGLIETIFFYILIIVILVGPIVGCVFVFKFIKKKIKK